MSYTPYNSSDGRSSQYSSMDQNVSSTECVAVSIHYREYGYPLKGAEPIFNMTRENTMTIEELVDTINNHNSGKVLRDTYWVNLPYDIKGMIVSANGHSETNYKEVEFRHARSNHTDLWAIEEAKGRQFRTSAYIKVLLYNSTYIQSMAADRIL